MTSKKSLSEEDIKLRYITPAIVKTWKHEQILMEHCFTDGQVLVIGRGKPERGAKKKADYLLSYRNGLPLAIVEAKDNNHSVGSGMQQALNYAEILDLPFAYSSNGDAFLEHDRKQGTERELPLDAFPSPAELWARFKNENALTRKQEALATEPYYYAAELHPRSPRYYQRVAVNRALDAVARGEKRILLVMATGTGKTYTAFQILYRLRQAGAVKKILYLADRNILIDQTMAQDFKPFEKVMTKITGKKLDSSYEIYMSLYQQLAGDEKEEPFRQFQPEFFDLVLVDECHRGSAREESRWRKILDYFHGAIQIGMTATPRESEEVSTSGYFGEPVYTYSLKQGIDDGFLAPYKVIRVGLDKDLEGFRPEAGELDKEGKEIEDRIYNSSDFDRTLILDARTQTVARRVTKFLRENGRFSKTIVFCANIDHAERMRQALSNENSDLVAQNAKYVMRITGDNDEGKRQLDYFIDVGSPYPTIVTTSKLLTTGVDCKTCKLIVLDSVINSMTEFKQIIGRGTRLYPDYGKSYFTIMDFRNATRLFADPEFDGEPVAVEEETNVGNDPEKETSSISGGKSNGELPVTPYEDGNGGKVSGNPPPVFHIGDDVPVTIIHELEQFIDADGKLVAGEYRGYSKKKILEDFSTLDVFLEAWNKDARKQAIIDALREKGVSLQALREESGNPNLDDFDLICHIAFDRKPLTKSERAKNVQKRDFLSRYEGLAREVLAALLEKYSRDGIADFASIQTLTLAPFKNMAGTKEILSAFGGKEKYIAAVKSLEDEIYAE